MGLIKRNIHMDGCRHENKTISLDQDYNIPDMKPDAKMIIREQGDIVNLECRSMGEKFGIKGEMSFQILYTAEENGQLACLRGSIPFEETLAVKMGERDEDYEVQVRVEKLNVRLINSRKTNITAILGIDLVDQKVCDNMICVGVEPEEGLQIKTRGGQKGHIPGTGAVEAAGYQGQHWRDPVLGYPVSRTGLPQSGGRDPVKWPGKGFCGICLRRRGSCA